MKQLELDFNDIANRKGMIAFSRELHTRSLHIVEKTIELLEFKELSSYRNTFSNQTEFIGTSPKFNVLEKGESIPSYTISLQVNLEGSIIGVKVERLK